MSPFLNDPGRRAVEPVVITRCKVYDAEVQCIPWLHSSSRRTPPPLERWPDAHLGRNRSVVRNNFRCGPFLRNRRVRPLTVLDSSRALASSDEWCGSGVHDRCARSGGCWGVVDLSAEQFLQTIFNAVDVGEMPIVGLGHVATLKDDLGARRLTSFNTEESIQGVGAPFDLLNTSALDGTKVEDCAVSRTNLPTYSGDNVSGKEMHK